VLTLHSDVLSWRRWTYGGSDVPPEWQSYRGLVQAALRRADRVVAVSRFLADEVQSLYAVDRPVEVIHNGWPLPSGVTQKERVTLIAGRIWDVAKNIQLAAEAAQGWTPGAVYVAGDTRHPDGGVAMVPPPLQPLGFLPRHELENWLRRAAIYLSPAKYDPFGLLPLQAALHGCALLLSDIPSYRELWDGAARFFRPADADDCRRQWRHLLEDPREMQQKALQRARSRYTAATMARMYHALYGQIQQRVAA
jgi:glycogen synthase